jgi:hypothetical protein
LLLACGGRTNADLPGGAAQAGSAGSGALSGSGGAGTVAGSAGNFAGGQAGTAGGFPAGSSGSAGGISAGGSAGFPSFGGSAGKAGGFPGGGGNAGKAGGFPGGGGSAGKAGGFSGTDAGAGCSLPDGRYYAPGEPIGPCCFCGFGGSIDCLPGCGAAGAAGAAGSSGMGGSDAGSLACPPEQPAAPLIDDFEDGDLKPNHPLAYGTWYAHHDGTGNQSWGLQSAAGGGWALHVSSLPHAMYGGWVGVALHGLTFGCPLSALGYAGLRFSIQANDIDVHVRIVLTATRPQAEGGTCTERCNDHFGITIRPQRWTGYAFTFEELKQQGWGSRAMFDPTQIRAIEFAVSQGTYYDVSIDDVRFF